MPMPSSSFRFCLGIAVVMASSKIGLPLASNFGGGSIACRQCDINRFAIGAGVNAARTFGRPELLAVLEFAPS